MTFDAHEVVVVRKRRPALVISARDFNETHGQLILAMITSTRHKWPSDITIKDWKRAGLVVPCRCRLKLFTLDQLSVLRRLGRLTVQDSVAMALALSCHLACGK